MHLSSLSIQRLRGALAGESCCSRMQAHPDLQVAGSRCYAVVHCHLGSTAAVRCQKAGSVTPALLLYDEEAHGCSFSCSLLCQRTGTCQQIGTGPGALPALPQFSDERLCARGIYNLQSTVYMRHLHCTWPRRQISISRPSTLLIMLLAARLYTLPGPAPHRRTAPCPLYFR